MVSDYNILKGKQMMEKQNLKVNKINYLAAVLFFLMFTVPVNFQVIKLSIMVVVGGWNIYLVIKTGYLYAHKKINTFTLLFLCYALIAACIGFSLGNPGAGGFFRVNIIYYIALYFVIIGFREKGDFVVAVKTVLAASNFIGLYTLSLLAYKTGNWPFPMFAVLDDTSNVGLHTGYIHITNTNLSMLIFIFPFLVLILYDKFITSVISRKYIIFTSVFAGIILIISGRRIMWIILIIGLVSVFLRGGMSLQKKINFIIAAGIFGVITLIVINELYAFSIAGVVERFKFAFSKIDEYGNTNVRMVQMSALFRGFLEYPLFGSGAGIGVKDCIRSLTSPWVYEQSYNLILYNSGLIGSTIYAVSLAVILFELYMHYRRGSSIAFAVFVGYAMAVFANGTNPYFSASFDFLLFIFLPLLYINCSDSLNKIDTDNGIQEESKIHGI
jgi:hypothetical protein